MFRVKSQQDFGAGVVFVIIGLIGLWFGRDLQFGTAGRMGPGYFPMILSGIIFALGILVLTKALIFDGPDIEKFRYRPIFFVLLGIVLFGTVIEYVGTFFAIIVLIVVSSLARADTKHMESLLLAVILSFFAVLIFIYGLGQSMPAWWGR